MTYTHSDGVLKQRFGQHWFNVLHCVRPSLANEIRSTSLDPFHYDEVSIEIENYVREHWTAE